MLDRVRHVDSPGYTWDFADDEGLWCDGGVGECCEGFGVCV
jgi:hypothetical protein